MEKKLIVIFTIPRTGSNHFVRLLEQYPGLDARYEVFHEQESFSVLQQEVETAAQRAGSPFRDRKDPAFIAWARTHPGRLLDIMKETRPEAQALVCKIFPDHLTSPILSSDILPRPDLRALVLKRRPIDSFISRMKTEHLRAFGHVDSTHVKVAISAERFVWWWNKQAAWYRFLETELARLGVPVQTITYEQDIDLPPSDCLAGMARRFEAFGLGLPAPDISVVSEFTKQDTNRDHRQKVSNWEAFERDITRLGYAERILAYF